MTIASLVTGCYSVQAAAVAKVMQRKIDFDLQPKEKIHISSIKVGEAVQIKPNEDRSSLSCFIADTQPLGELPSNVASSLPPYTVFTAAVRSIKRCTDDQESVSSIQIRISCQPAEQRKPLVQAEPPADDPAGFTLTTTELERLAYNEEFRRTLGDKRLQELLVTIDGAANREQALKQALDTPDFREFADKMLEIMKPTDYPRIL